jgi:DNA-binding transcriptional regulator YdaS (Cro superfamily)
MEAANLISEAIEIVGLGDLAKACGVSYQAVRKWEAAGRLPRTEWTGETHYATAIETATAGKVTQQKLLKLAVA